VLKEQYLRMYNTLCTIQYLGLRVVTKVPTVLRYPVKPLHFLFLSLLGGKDERTPGWDEIMRAGGLFVRIVSDICLPYLGKAP
jgi:hypothetical protein